MEDCRRYHLWGDRAANAGDLDPNRSVAVSDCCALTRHQPEMIWSQRPASDHRRRHPKRRWGWRWRRLRGQLGRATRFGLSRPKSRRGVVKTFGWLIAFAILISDDFWWGSVRSFGMYSMETHLYGVFVRLTQAREMLVWSSQLVFLIVSIFKLLIPTRKCI